MLKTVRCHVTVRMVGFLEGAVTEGWVGTLQATLGPIGLLGWRLHLFLCQPGPGEYVTASLNIVTFSTQGHAPA